MSSRLSALGALPALFALLLSRQVHAADIDPLIPDQAIVRLIPGADINAVNTRHGTATLRAIANRPIYLLDMPDGVDPEIFRDQLRDDPDVNYVDFNYASEAPEARGRTFFFNVMPVPDQYQTQAVWSAIGLPQAHQHSNGGGVLLAMVDGGLEIAHPALAGHIAPGGQNLIDGSANLEDVGDGQDNDSDGLVDEAVGHGTHIAGILAHVAPQAAILPLVVLDSDGLTDNFLLAAGVFAALDAGAVVVNVSIGTTYDSKVLEDALDEAELAGVVVVAAAGNLNRSAPPEYPAVLAAALGVVSVDGADVKSSFSNFGALMDLAAPGEAVYSTIPGGQYAAWSGTSMATPLVSGAAALLLARHADWPASIRAVRVTTYLQNTAVAIDAGNPGFAGQLGAGRLDVDAAVRDILGDLNCDARVNVLDINAFVLAIEDAAAYAAAHPFCDRGLADLNGDGMVNVLDIGPFVDSLLAP
ncbi:Thermitase [Phycisphaerae bacterium RAS1]|nr:Thermitase [Phycisphaerae bacterium RAS1]